MQIVLFALLTFIVAAAPAAGSITRIVIDPARSESPAFEGRVFGPDGGVGPYEKLRGKAYGEVDPDDPRNAVITDIELAPRNARGKVEYSMDIFILKPIDLRRATTSCFSTSTTAARCAWARSTTRPRATTPRRPPTPAPASS